MIILLRLLYYSITCNDPRYYSITCNDPRYYSITCNDPRYYSITCNDPRYFRLFISLTNVPELPPSEQNLVPVGYQESILQPGQPTIKAASNTHLPNLIILFNKQAPHLSSSQSPSSSSSIFHYLLN